MVTKHEALKIALEALEANLANWNAKRKAIPIIREALAQPEQEPVAYTGNGTAGREADVRPTGFFFQADKRQPEQEPVAWMNPQWIDPDTRGWPSESFEALPIEGWLPLYTTPPQRKPLTDEEIGRIAGETLDPWSCARAIEAAHGIKEHK